MMAARTAKAKFLGTVRGWDLWVRPDGFPRRIDFDPSLHRVIVEGNITATEIDTAIDGQQVDFPLGDCRLTPGAWPPPALASVG